VITRAQRRLFRDIRQDMHEPIQDLDLRRATEEDVDALADAHRDSIRALGSQHYAPAIVNAWAGVVHPELYVQAMDRGEVFFLATGTVAGRPMVLGFSSDYIIDGGLHGTSAYVRRVAARQGVGSRLLELAESFGRGRGAASIHIEAALGAVEFYRRHGFVETGHGPRGPPLGLPDALCVHAQELVAGAPEHVGRQVVTNGRACRGLPSARRIGDIRCHTWLVPMSNGT